MAKTSSSDFFKNARPRIGISDVSLLENTSGDPRIKIDCFITLAGKNLTRCGPQVSRMLESVGKEDSPLSSGKSKIRIEGTQVRFYPTDDKKTPQMKINNATINNLRVASVDRAKGTSDVTLYLTIYCPATKPLWDWGYELHRGECWVEFEPGQMTLGEKKEEEAEPEEAAQGTLIEDPEQKKAGNKPN